MLQQRVSAGNRPLCYPATLWNPRPEGTAKGCRGAARDILVVALAGHNSLVAVSVEY